MRQVLHRQPRKGAQASRVDYQHHCSRLVHREVRLRSGCVRDNCLMHHRQRCAAPPPRSNAIRMANRLHRKHSRQSAVLSHPEARRCGVRGARLERQLQQPEYPGGIRSLMKFGQNSLSLLYHCKSLFIHCFLLSNHWEVTLFHWLSLTITCHHCNLMQQ